MQAKIDIPYYSKIASKRKKCWQIWNIKGFAWCFFRNRSKSILERASKVFLSGGSLYPGQCQPNLLTSYLSAVMKLLGQSSANTRWALLYQPGWARLCCGHKGPTLVAYSNTSYSCDKNITGWQQALFHGIWATPGPRLISSCHLTHAREKNRMVETESLVLQALARRALISSVKVNPEATPDFKVPEKWDYTTCPDWGRTAVLSEQIWCA